MQKGGAKWGEPRQFKAIRNDVPLARSLLKRVLQLLGQSALRPAKHIVSDLKRLEGRVRIQEERDVIQSSDEIDLCSDSTDHGYKRDDFENRLHEKQEPQNPWQRSRRLPGHIPDGDGELMAAL
jgi:hypothetical protein